MTIWQWFRENSQALQGAAASVVIVTAVVGTPALLWRALRPDIAVRYTDTEHITIPVRPSREWFDKFEAAVNSMPKGEGSDSFRKLLILATNAKMKWWSTGPVMHETIEIANQSDRAISGVRLSFGQALGLFPEITVSGTFLTQSEKDRYLGQIREMKSLTGTNVLLPEIPPLPPGGVLVLELYGGATINPIVSVSGATSQVVKVIKVDETWLMHWYRSPGLVVLTLLVVMILVAMGGFQIVKRRRARPAA